MLVVRTSSRVSFTSTQSRKLRYLKWFYVLSCIYFFFSFLFFIIIFFFCLIMAIWLCDSLQLHLHFNQNKYLFHYLHFKKKTSFKIIWKNYKQLFFLYRRECWVLVVVFKLFMHLCLPAYKQFTAVLHAKFKSRKKRFKKATNTRSWSLICSEKPCL